MSILKKIKINSKTRQNPPWNLNFVKNEKRRNYTDMLKFKLKIIELFFFLFVFYIFLHYSEFIVIISIF